MKHEQALDVVVAGLAVVDIIVKPVDLRKPPRKGGLKFLETVSMSSGGNVSNVGIDLSKLGFRVGAITRTGNDALGRFLLEEYAANSIETSGVAVDRTAQTSATIVSVDASGERTFFHTRGCMARFRATDVLTRLKLVSRARYLSFGYLGLLPQMERHLPRLFRTIKERTGTKILLDTGGEPHRLTKSRLRRILPWVDYFFPSFGEAVALTGKRTPEAIVDFLFDAGAANVVGVKLGAKGCYIADSRTARYLKGQRVRNVIDTTGAGDAFVAGFLAGTLKGLDPFEAARLGNAVAASCVTAIGASTAVQHVKHYL